MGMSPRLEAVRAGATLFFSSRIHEMFGLAG
jgi:hypothetical protein